MIEVPFRKNPNSWYTRFAFLPRPGYPSVATLHSSLIIFKHWRCYLGFDSLQLATQHLPVVWRLFWCFQVMVKQHLALICSSRGYPSACRSSLSLRHRQALLHLYHRCKFDLAWLHLLSFFYVCQIDFDPSQTSPCIACSELLPSCAKFFKDASWPVWLTTSG